MDESYFCMKCNRKHVRGKIYAEHKMHARGNPKADNTIEIHEPSVKRAVEEMSEEDFKTYQPLSSVNDILSSLGVKEARNILNGRPVYCPQMDSVASWRLEIWHPVSGGKDIPFSLLESQKYAIFIALARGKKFGRRAKKKWRKFLKQLD